MSKIAGKAFYILSAFSIDHPRMSPEQLVQKTQIPQSSLYRFLKRLLEDGYLTKGQDGAYRLGPAVLQLGRIAEAGYEVRTLAIPWMERLWEKTGGETISLWVRFGDERLCVEGRERRGGGIKFSSSPGDTRPLYAGAAGKVLLAYMEESEVRAILKRVSLSKITPQTVMSVQVLLKQLEDIRNKGFAYTEGEVTPGAYAISSPLINSRGFAEAALTITGILEQNKKEKIEKFPAILLEATGNISETMGYSKIK